MDNETIKHVLSGYRPNGRDADDEALREALEHCRRDPTAQAWLEDQLAFDRRMAGLMRSVHAPEEGKRIIQETIRFDRKIFKAKLYQRAARFSAIAAALVLLVLGGWQTALWMGKNDPVSIEADTNVVALAENVISLDYRANTVDELKAWLVAHEAPVPVNLPAAMGGLPAAGCRIFTDAAGGKVSLLCLMMDGELMHVFVTDRASTLTPAIPSREWHKEGEWNLYRWDDRDRSVTIVSRSAPEALEQLLQKV